MKSELIIYSILCLSALSIFGFESRKYTPEKDMKFVSFEVSGIGELEVNTSANIYFIPSEQYELKIEGERSLVENVKIKKNCNKMSIGIKSIFNPIKLLKLAYSNEPVNIYISAPNAKDIKVSNRNNFANSNYYENEDVAMITLKQPKLFNLENNTTCEPV